MAAPIIGIASDHAAFDLKGRLCAFLKEQGAMVRDFGPHSPEACDYPAFVVPCAQALASGELDLAVVACGSGIGASISANKVKGVRAALCLEVEQGILSRQHTDARCLVLAARLRGMEQNLAIVEAWLAAAFEGGRHQRRIELLHQLTAC